MAAECPTPRQESPEGPSAGRSSTRTHRTSPDKRICRSALHEKRDRTFRQIQAVHNKKKISYRGSEFQAVRRETLLQRGLLLGFCLANEVFDNLYGARGRPVFLPRVFHNVPIC